MSGAILIRKTEYLFWVLFLVMLPVTSFPYFPSGFGGSTLVRPLSVYPLLILIIIGVVPRIISRPVSRTLLPFLVFVLVAVGSTLLGLIRNIDPLVGVTVLDRSVRALVTLFLGGGFYFAVSLIPDTPEKFRSSLRWMYAGFSVALFWGSLQAVYVLNFQRTYFNLLSQIQSLISIRKLFPTRISGMTYEPNWFAEQIVFLLMPWLFSAVISGYSVFRWRLRWRWLSVEFLLLLWAAAVLLFTFSRSGIILLSFQVVLVFLFRPRARRSAESADHRIPWKLIVKRLFQSIMVLTMLIGIVFVVGSRNNYFSRLWNYWEDEDATGRYLQYIAFDQRFIYWGTAYRIYEENPLLGVGLGNFTFYLDEYLPDRPLYPTPELLTKITPEEGRSQLSSVKGVFPRLLAETGVIGMATFLGFLIALVGCALYLVLGGKGELEFGGRAGLLGLGVFLVVSFSFDSFSLPNMWVMFGLITASSQVFASKAGGSERKTKRAIS